MEKQPDFKIFSSLRYDTSLSEAESQKQDISNHVGPLYMLTYHRDRLLQAAQHFEWSSCVSKLEGNQETSWLQDRIGKSHSIIGKEACCRVRVTLDMHGNIEVEAMPTPRLNHLNLFPSQEVLDSHLRTTEYEASADLGIIWNVFLDTEATPKSAFTLYKTTSRDMYTAARDRVHIASLASPEEVLLYNLDGEITEASLTSVYVFRHGQWVTPGSQCGGQLGVTRRWALEQRICVEGIVRTTDLVEGENMWLSNGVRGFIRARYRSSRPFDEGRPNHKTTQTSNGMVNMSGDIRADGARSS